jgi:release factor glutamine methyltransferase
MDLRVLFEVTRQRLLKLCENPREECELIIEAVSGHKAVKEFTHPNEAIERAELDRIDAIIEGRMRGVPLAHLLGFKDFYNHRFMVSPSVLIPRPESELIVELALKGLSKEKGSPAIADLGTGSGCIGLSLLAEHPSARLTAIDISKEALEVARANAEGLGVEERVHFVNSDVEEWGKTCEVSFDLVVANPPYIAEGDPDVDEAVKAYEPHLALFSGHDGLEAIRSWSSVTANVLKDKGLTLFEFGYAQATDVVKIFDAMGKFEEIRVEEDYSHYDRILIARRKA